MTNQLFTNLGMSIELVGFAVVGLYMYRQWRHTAVEGQPFAHHRVDTFVRKLIRRPRRPHVVTLGDAAVGVDTSADHQVDLGFDSEASTSARLQKLEGLMSNVYNMHLASAKSLGERIDAVKRDQIRSRGELRQTIDTVERERERAATGDLRNAGWGLIFAVIGLLIQFLAAVF
ncbi:hypothetical protein MTX35_24965 [Rhodococcus sp. ARC_M12]|uniref:hypothetical protein n=1 Tax=Rhodococcus sp. ARC_M12 TaxID=2928854 RepID=UPI001FB56DBB|nr:hypothetical protein [Rhodococcus sp. ARC_M12]MCJ0980956.1 hypothetical protein [Rhodococcus sp. ARC_M12]